MQWEFYSVNRDAVSVKECLQHDVGLGLIPFIPAGTFQNRDHPCVHTCFFLIKICSGFVYVYEHKDYQDGCTIDLSWCFPHTHTLSLSRWVHNVSRQFYEEKRFKNGFFLIPKNIQNLNRVLSFKIFKVVRP